MTIENVGFYRDYSFLLVNFSYVKKGEFT